MSFPTIFLWKWLTYTIYPDLFPSNCDKQGIVRPCNILPKLPFVLKFIKYYLTAFQRKWMQITRIFAEKRTVPKSIVPIMDVYSLVQKVTVIIFSTQFYQMSNYYLSLRIMQNYSSSFSGLYNLYYNLYKIICKCQYYR